MGFEVVAEETLYQGYVISFSRVQMRDPDGVLHGRDVVRHPGAVSVVAVEDDAIWFVEQFRVPTARTLLEIPAGKLDPGEPPESCAARELAEELGYRADSFDLLHRFFITPGYSDEWHYVFLARGLTPLASNAPDGAEERFMNARRIPLVEVARMLASDEIADAKTLIGCSAALRVLGRE